MAVASLQWLPGAADASFMPRSTAVHRSTAGQLSLLSQCQSGFRRGLPWFRQRLLAGAGACGQREPQVAFGSSGSRRGRSGLAVHAAAADVTDISSTSPLPASLELAVQVAPLHASHPDSALVPLPLLSFPSQILDPAAFLPSPLSSGVAAPHAESVMTASLPAVAPPLPLQQAMASADVRAASAVAEAVVLGDAMGPPRSVEEAIRMAMRNAMEGSDDGDMATEEADDIMARARNPFRMRALDMQPAEPAPAAAPAPALTDARVDAGEKQAEPESGLQNALQNLLPPLNWPNQAAPPIDAPASPAFAPPALPVGPPLSDASAPPALTDTVRGRRQFRRSDFVVGRRLGEGNFGTVYEGALKKKGKASEEEEFGRRSRQLDDLDERDIKSRVILKKVKTRVMGGEQSGEMEEWFNRRMQRVAPEACARFMGSFTADVTRAQFTEGGKWLVWNYEGDRTLLDYIRERDFPDNVEEAIFGRGQMVLQGLDSVARRGVTVKQVLRQVLISLKKMHATGIVHRDVKPSNLVITNTGRVKLIDFGAAADLRIGMNYEPELALLDPDYAPPEQFVLPEETPSPPAAPIAAMLSPALWQFNHPDLFDTYSVGIIFLQMASPTLRTPAGLQTFKKELRAARYDLKRWRRETRMRPDLRVLDLEGGAGWDLATRLVCERGTLRKGRLSAAEALRHPYLLLGVDQAATAISKLTLSR
ncbi:hypothetical protein CLOM_g22814 [Closterium sp. NIES-68]|nr:hypothetical protein CLOM_g22814 [Closterium sp. NIES-68]GJP72800.1 hypothetical protein CLOP_g3558 [Closterium sp. NIES-67]